MPQRARSCPLQKYPELPSSSQKDFTSSVSRVSRGYKCNNVSNPAHRLTCKYALSRLCMLPLGIQRFVFVSCWVFAQILALFPGFPVRLRQLFCSDSAPTVSKAGRLTVTCINHANNLKVGLQSPAWMRCPIQPNASHLWIPLPEPACLG